MTRAASLAHTRCGGGVAFRRMERRTCRGRSPRDESGQAQVSLLDAALSSIAQKNRASSPSRRSRKLFGTGKP